MTPKFSIRTASSIFPVYNACNPLFLNLTPYFIDNVVGHTDSNDFKFRYTMQHLSLLSLEVPFYFF